VQARAFVWSFTLASVRERRREKCLIHRGVLASGEEKRESKRGSSSNILEAPVIIQKKHQ